MSTREIATNNASSTLAAGIGTGDLSIAVVTGEGSRFPAPAAGQFAYVTLVDSAGNLEIVKVTERSADTMTIERAQQGTSARTFIAGDRVSHRVTKSVLERGVQKDADEVITGTLSAPAPTQNAHVVRKIDLDGKVSKAGDTMTGFLTLVGNAVNPLHAVPLQQMQAAEAAIDARLDALEGGGGGGGGGGTIQWSTTYNGTPLATVNLLGTYGPGVYVVSALDTSLGSVQINAVVFAFSGGPSATQVTKDAFIMVGSTSLTGIYNPASDLVFDIHKILKLASS